MVARLVISPVVPAITNEFAVSTGAVGLALSAMWAAYALSQYPSGILADHFGERKIILLAVGLTAVASILLAASPTFSVFFLMTVGLGIGAGLHYTVATTFLAKHFEQVGKAIGVHVAGGPLAGLIAPVAAVAVGVRYGWRSAMVLGALAAIPVFALFWWQIERTPVNRTPTNIRSHVDPGTVFGLLNRPEIRHTTILAIGGAFVWQATASFLPAFLIIYHGFTTGMAGVLFSIYFVIHGATQPLMGSLSDRIGRDATAAGAFSIGVIGYGALVVGDGLWIYLAIPLVGLGMSWGAPVQTRFIDYLSDSERATGFGLVRTVYMLLGSLGSVVVGGLADVVGWHVAFGLLVGILLLEVVLITIHSWREG